MPLLLYPRGKSLWYPEDRRLGSPRISLDIVEKILALQGIEPGLSRPIACHSIN
jgi:hypothetical protein